MKNTQRSFGRLLLGSQDTDIGLLLLRVITGVMIFSHGLAKIENFAELSAGFPDPLGLGAKTSLVLIILAEAGCAWLLITGLLTRLATLPLIFGMGVAAFIVHAPFTFAGSELPLTYLLIFVVLLLTGGGKYSLDYYLCSRCCKRP